MSCELTGEGGGVYAVMSFHREQLLYDIRNLAYIEGEVMEPATPDHNRHMVQDAGEYGNVNRITRILDLGVARCKEQLYPYTKYSLEKRSIDDRLREQKIYGIVMSVGDDFSQTTLNLLEHLIHEYLVALAVSDWLSITNPGKSGVWAEKAEKALREMKLSATNRVKGTRIKQHWI